MQAQLELAPDGVRGPLARLGAGNDDHQLALGAHAELHERRERAALDGARAALGDRQHPRPPVALLGLLRPGARHDHGSAVAQVAAELLGAREDVLAVGDLAPEQVLEEVADRRLARPLRRLRALELEPDQARHEAQQVGRGRRAVRPVAQLADDLVGHSQLHLLAAALAGQHGALVLGGLAGHGQHARRGVEHDHAGAQGPARRAGHGRKPGAGLDRLGDLVEGLEERPRLRLLGSAAGALLRRRHGGHCRRAARYA